MTIYRVLVDIYIYSNNSCNDRTKKKPQPNNPQPPSFLLE